MNKLALSVWRIIYKLHAKKLEKFHKFSYFRLPKVMLTSSPGMVQTQITIIYSQTKVCFITVSSLLGINCKANTNIGSKRCFLPAKPKPLGGRGGWLKDWMGLFHLATLWRPPLLVAHSLDLWQQTTKIVFHSALSSRCSCLWVACAITLVGLELPECWGFQCSDSNS